VRRISIWIVGGPISIEGNSWIIGTGVSLGKGKGDARLVYSGSIPSRAFGKTMCRGVIYAYCTGVGRTDLLWVATLFLCTRFTSPGMLSNSISGQVLRILSVHNSSKGCTLEWFGKIGRPWPG